MKLALGLAGLALAAPFEDGVPAPAAAARDEVPVVRDEDLPAAVREGIAGGVRWLLENQRASGAWGSHHSPRPIEVLADVPGSHDAFRVATTGLCVAALHDVGDDDPAIAAAIDRAVDCLIAEHDVKRVSGLEHYNVWAFGYGLRGLGRHLMERPDDPRADEIRAVCRHLVEKLEGYQVLDGGWGYLSLSPPRTHPPSQTSMSFTTATVMVGLDRARRAGIELPERMVERAVRSVESCRTPTGTFTYGPLWNRSPAAGINQEKGAACRTPACQWALDLFGRDVADADYRTSLENLLVRHARFQILSLRRPIPHESWHAISGYFYLYGHAYAANVLEGLPERDRRRYSPELARAVLRTRQPDGSFWDYPLYSYHKPYGTAYALIALTRVELDGPPRR